MIGTLPRTLLCVRVRTEVEALSSTRKRLHLYTVGPRDRKHIAHLFSVPYSEIGTISIAFSISELLVGFGNCLALNF